MSRRVRWGSIAGAIGVVNRRGAALAVLFAALLSSVGGCGGGDSLSPEIDCAGVIGFPFVVLDPTPPGVQGYQVAKGASIQIAASLSRVTEAEPAFNVQQGWYCVTTASVPATGTVIFSTTDTDIVQLAAGGVIHGLVEGFATITARSANPVAETVFGVHVQ